MILCSYLQESDKNSLRTEGVCSLCLQGLHLSLTNIVDIWPQVLNWLIGNNSGWSSRLEDEQPSTYLLMKAITKWRRVSFKLSIFQQYWANLCTFHGNQPLWNWILMPTTAVNLTTLMPALSFHSKLASAYLQKIYRFHLGPRVKRTARNWPTASE